MNRFSPFFRLGLRSLKNQNNYTTSSTLNNLISKVKENYDLDKKEKQLFLNEIERRIKDAKIHTDRFETEIKTARESSDKPPFNDFYIKDTMDLRDQYQLEIYKCQILRSQLNKNKE